MCASGIVSGVPEDMASLRPRRRSREVAKAQHVYTAPRVR